jgi:hypothetical protein
MYEEGLITTPHITCIRRTPHTGNVWSCYYSLPIQVMCGVVIIPLIQVMCGVVITTPHITCIGRG